MSESAHIHPGDIHDYERSVTRHGDTRGGKGKLFIFVMERKPQPGWSIYKEYAFEPAIFTQLPPTNVQGFRSQTTGLPLLRTCPLVTH